MLDAYRRNATGFSNEHGHISIVSKSTFDWGDHRFQMLSWNELVIYEMHIGPFNNVDGGPGSFDQAIEKLNYLQVLGVNAIEVMPVSVFNKSTSEGYNFDLLFAIDSAHGTQHAAQKVVQAAHAIVLAAICDVVYNHFGTEQHQDCLFQFDGWSLDGGTELQGIYFYSDDRRVTNYGERPNCRRPEVCQFIDNNAMMWLHEFQADGLRFDSTLNIRRANFKWLGNIGDIPEGWRLLQRTNNENDTQLP